jgi:hypothetical protein
MSLGGISDYLKTNNISTPEDQSSTPYLPYAQQGPYQAIMSQMGNYGGSAGTGYQQGMGNVYGGAGGGAMGGFNPDLYKRAAPAAPVVLPDMGGGNRGGGSGGDRSGGQYGDSYGAKSFNYDPNSYTGGLLRFLLGEQTPAPIVDTSGFSSVAEAEAAQPGINSGIISQPNPISGYSLNPNSLFGTAAGSNIGTIRQPNPISGYSIGPAPVAVAQPETYSPITSNDIPSNDNYSNEGYGRSGGRDGDGGGGAATGGRDGDASGGGDRGTRGGFAKGGQVSMQHLKGPNPAGPDQGYGALKSGEFVINDKAVAKYGIDLMNAINSGKISKGKLRGLLEM